MRMIVMVSGAASPNFRGLKLHRLFQWRTQDLAKGVPQGGGVGAKPPVAGG